MGNDDFITRNELNHNLEKLEKTFNDSFMRNDEKLDRLHDLVAEGSFKSLDDRKETIKELENAMTTRISTVVAAGIFMVSSLAAIGAILLTNAERITDSKFNVIETKLDAMEKQMIEEFDWIYETKAEKLEIENLRIRYDKN